MKKLGFYIKKKMYYVTIIRTLNKNMYLKVKGDSLIVSAPKKVKEKEIRKFVDIHIEKMIEYINNKKKTELFSINNNFVNLNGKKYSIKVLTGFKNNSIILKNKTAYINTSLGTHEEIEKTIKSFLRDDLLKYIKKRISYFEKEMELPNHIVRVVYKTATWGTNLVGKYKISFSSRLAHYRREITDYVIVHELAHTIIPNHSSEFWNVVEKYFPNYKKLRNELKADQTLIE